MGVQFQKGAVMEPFLLVFALASLIFVFGISTSLATNSGQYTGSDVNDFTSFVAQIEPWPWEDFSLVRAEEIRGFDVLLHVDLHLDVKNLFLLRGGGCLGVADGSLMYRVGEGNGERMRREAIIFFLKQNGIITSQMSLGDRRAGEVIQSWDGSLISVVSAGEDESVASIIFNSQGDVIIESAEISDLSLVPSVTGERIVSPESERIFLNRQVSLIRSGQEIQERWSRFYSREGFPLDLPSRGTGEEYSRKIALVIGDRCLEYVWYKPRGHWSLRMSDLSHDTVVWENEYPIGPRVMKCCRRPNDKRWFVLLYSPPCRGEYYYGVLDWESGEIVSRFTAQLFRPVGSLDGHFYSKAHGSVHRNGRFDFTILKHSIDSEIVAAGMCPDGLPPKFVHENRGIVWGIYQDVSIRGEHYPEVRNVSTTLRHLGHEFTERGSARSCLA